MPNIETSLRTEFVASGGRDEFPAATCLTWLGPLIIYVRDRERAWRVAAGDHVAFGRFFGAEFPRLYQFVLYWVRRDEEAVRGMGGYRGEASWRWDFAASSEAAAPVFRGGS